MKSQRITKTGNEMALSANSLNKGLTAASKSAARIGSLGMLAFLLALFPTSPAGAQTAEFRVNQVRVTVPVGTTNVTVVTNIIADIIGQDTNSPIAVNFDVTGLPVNASYTLTDVSNNVVTSAIDDTNLFLTLYTTNIAEGIHTFRLNATSTGATNYILLILQSAHVWNGALDASNSWSSAVSWGLGGIPGATSDVVFGDTGAQTNQLGFTNSFLDVDFTISSLRFSHSGETNAAATNDDARPLFHTLQIAPSRTLTITGTNGFSMLRDYVDDFTFPNRRMGVTIQGGTGSRLVVTNANANFALLLAEQSFANHSFLNLSNLNTFIAHVNRMGLAEYQLYPNYQNYNAANDFDGNPSKFVVDVSFARTNFITALHKDPDNYTNELTRSYALSLGNNERDGNGSSVNSFINLGQSNAFFLDSICIGGASYAIGNGGQFRFNPVWTNSSAIFRGTNNTRMSMFTISDNGGSGEDADTTRVTTDFAAGNGNLDILTDRFIISRDRQFIGSNNNPVVEGTLIMGRGTVNANTAILGYQEHDGKTNWTAIGGAQAYRNYCRGTLTVGSAGLFRVNGIMTLGFTADTNPEAVAEQFNTWGAINVNSNGTVAVHTIVADGGLNFTSLSSARQNRITLNQGLLIVTNTIGAAPGLPLDSLNMTAGTLNLRVTAGSTNVFVKSFVNLGSIPSVVRIASVTGVTSYPTNIPLISYESATPFLTADITGASGLVAGAQGYIINNAANKTIELFLTTNAPNNLIWKGTANNNWDLSSLNWVTTVGGFTTNFSLGDVVTFDDSTIVTNVDVTDVVVPNQAASAGVTINNSTRNYSFEAAGGAIAGTAALLKTGTGSLTFNSVEAGPLTVLGGNLNGSGVLGTTTIGSNVLVNFAGSINGGLNSTGTIVMAVGSSISGAVNLRGGSFDNSGSVATSPGTITIFTGVNVTNEAAGLMSVAGGNWNLPENTTLANFGTIYSGIGGAGRLNFSGLYFGTGSFLDPDGGLTGVDARFAANPGAICSPGALPFNSIGTLYVGARVDLNDTPAAGLATLLIEVDFADPQTNDIVLADFWSNINGLLQLTNINPGAGSFGPGQSFRVFVNNNGPTFINDPDAEGTIPTLSPVVPAPGLQWGLADFPSYGIITITNTLLLWNGDLSGSWDTNTANWQGSKIYGDNQGAMFDDSASGTTTITLTNFMAPAGWAITSNIVAGVTNRFTNAPVMSPGIVINNNTKPYVFIAGSTNGKISGMTGLYKIGPGTATILTTNDFTGNTIIAGGTLAITNTLGLGANGNANGTRANNNQVFIDGGNLRYVALYNGSLARATSIGSGNATIDVTSSTNELTAGAIVGPGALTKIGAGSLVLNSASGYLGGTTLSNGTLRINGGSDRLGTGALTLAGGLLNFSGNLFTVTNAINIVGTASTINNTNTYVSSGPWAGSGSVFLNNTSTFALSGNIATFSGTVTLSTNAGTLRFNNATNANNCTGSASATFNLGTGSATLNNLNGGGVTYNLGAIAGGVNTTLAGRSSNAVSYAAASTYSIGGNNSDSTFNGKIVNGADTVSVTKVGTGKLFLNGINTYTGPTTVSAGTLGGTGSIGGTLSVGASGTLAPGASVGTFTVAGAATLSGATIMELNRNASPLKNDRLVAPSITAGGTLLVTNIGPVLVNGTTFQLFSVPVSGFTTVTLPAGYTWNNTLAANGSIQVVSGGLNGTPTNIVTSVSGNTLTLSWPSSHIGWLLWSNSAGLAQTSMWFPVAGSDTTNQIPMNMDVTKNNVFFRMVLP